MTLPSPEVTAHMSVMRGIGNHAALNRISQIILKENFSGLRVDRVEKSSAFAGKIRSEAVIAIPAISGVGDSYRQRLFRSPRRSLSNARELLKAPWSIARRSSSSRPCSPRHARRFFILHVHGAPLIIRWHDEQTEFGL